MRVQFLDPEPRWCREESAAYVVVPVEYDGTSTYGKGADRGPDALLDASRYLEKYDIETGLEAYTAGIYTSDPTFDFSVPERMVAGVRDAVLEVLEKGKIPVVIGGEHSVSIGAIRAAAECAGPVSVLQLDAHGDLQDVYKGSPLNHGCVMARAQEVAERCVQVGIRSMDIRELERAERSTMFYAADIYDNNLWMEKVIDALGERVYLTVDLDVFDPSIMPSTGTPEPGGLGWYQVLEMLRLLIRRRRIVAFDIVELCPGENRASDFTAAKLLYKIISYMEEKKRIQR